jgi:hypothetical protein
MTAIIYFKQLIHHKSKYPYNIPYSGVFNKKNFHCCNFTVQ